MVHNKVWRFVLKQTSNISSLAPLRPRSHISQTVETKSKCRQCSFEHLNTIMSNTERTTQEADRYCHRFNYKMKWCHTLPRELVMTINQHIYLYMDALTQKLYSSKNIPHSEVLFAVTCKKVGHPYCLPTGLEITRKNYLSLGNVSKTTPN